jgi:hypothetical protein
VLQWQRRDETFRLRAGAVNAARVHARLAKKEKVIMVVSTVLALNARDLVVSLDSPVRLPIFFYISTRRALRLLTLPLSLAFLVPVPRS